MTAGCGAEARCLLIFISRPRQTCLRPRLLSTLLTRPSISANSTSEPLQQASKAFRLSSVHFSSTAISGLPRSRSRRKSAKLPGFRNETPELRFIREHNLFDPLDEFHGDPPRTAEAFQRAKHRTTTPVRLTPSADLEHELLHRSTHSPPSSKTLNLLEHLVCERGERPNAAHYEALILANSSPEYGSANNLQRILQEMEEQHVPLNVNIYTAILRTLVVHPDVEILTKVIESCDKMWIDLDQEMLHFVCAIYIRANMPDLAEDYLDRVEGLGARGSDGAANTSGKADLWLYIVFIRQLAIHHDWDGVLRLCYRLQDTASLGIPLAMRQVDVPYYFWHWLLEQAASAGERWVSFWIWDIWVQRAWIRPSPSLCLDMLRICAEHGLAKSAHGIVSVLANLTPADRAQDFKQAPLDRDMEKSEAGRLLQLAITTAKPEALRYESAGHELAAPYWTMFKDVRGPETEFATKLRIDPWVKLTERNDAGQSWPRILREREDAEQRRQLHRAKIRAKRTEKAKAQAIQTALQSFPEELLQDIHIAANMEPEYGEVIGIDEAMRNSSSAKTILYDADYINNASSVLGLNEPLQTNLWPRGLPPDAETYALPARKSTSEVFGDGKTIKDRGRQGRRSVEALKRRAQRIATQRAGRTATHSSSKHHIDRSEQRSKQE